MRGLPHLPGVPTRTSPPGIRGRLQPRPRPKSCCRLIRVHRPQNQPSPVRRQKGKMGRLRSPRLQLRPARISSQDALRRLPMSLRPNPTPAYAATQTPRILKLSASKSSSTACATMPRRVAPSTTNCAARSSRCGPASAMKTPSSRHRQARLGTGSMMLPAKLHTRRPRTSLTSRLRPTLGARKHTCVRAPAIS
jgi:hypothetical protein